MKKEEVTKWLTIMKANLNSFPEVSNAKKIEALAEAIRLLKNEQSEEPSSSGKPNKSEIPTGSDDCISRQAVLEIYDEWFATCNIADRKASPKAKINALPPVKPIRPKGYWIENAPEYQNIDPPYICSECGYMHLIKTNYCDQCGADMREVEE